jgi:hypothetical protein
MVITGMVLRLRKREHFVDRLATAAYKASDMGDKSITKVSAATAPRAPMGQKYLASGIRFSMRDGEVHRRNHSRLEEDFPQSLQSKYCHKKVLVYVG